MFIREHDRDPIKFEDVYCQRIIRATKEVPYVDIGDPLELSEQEPSTPDNNYEPADVITHLAEQERSFSDESVARSSPRLQERARRQVAAAEDVKQNGARSDQEEKVVYSEQEMDNRCVATTDDTAEDRGANDKSMW